MSSTTATTANPGTDDGVQLKYLALITLIIPFGIVCFVVYICYDRRRRKSQMMAIKLSGERCVGEPDNENINQALAADDDDDAEKNNKRCTTGNYNPRLVWPNRNLLNGHATSQENMVNDGANHRIEHSDEESTFDPLGHEAQSQQERRARRRLRVLQHDNVTNIVNVNGTKLDEFRENNENNARSINLYSPVDIHVERNVNSTGTFTKSNVFYSKFSNSKCTEAAGKFYSQQNVQLKSNDLLNSQYIDVDNNDYEYDESVDNSEESSDAYGPIYARSLMQTKGASSSAELLQKLKNNTVGVNKLTPSSIANIAGANTDNGISGKSKSIRISYNEPQSAVQESFNSQRQNDNTHGNSCEMYKESIIPTVRHYDPTVYNATTQVLLNMHEAPIEANNDSAFCNSNAYGKIKGDGGAMNVLDSTINDNTTFGNNNNSAQRKSSSLSSPARMEIPLAKQNLVVPETSSSVTSMQQSDIICALPNVSKDKEVTKLAETTVAIHKRTLSDALRRKEESAFENILEQASLPPIVPKQLHGKSICNAAEQNKSHLNATSNNLGTANVNSTNTVNAKQANENESHNAANTANDDDDIGEQGSYEYETADSDEDVSGKHNYQL